MSDNITLPREVVELALEALDSGHPDIQLRAAIGLRKALAAPRLEVTVDPRLTAEEAAAISAALAAEQPKQEAKQEPVAYFDLQKQVFYWARPTMIDVPMTVALEPLPLYTAPPEDEALRRDAERYRWLQDAGQKYWMEFADMTAEATEAAIDAAMEDKR